MVNFPYNPLTWALIWGSNFLKYFCLALFGRTGHWLPHSVTDFQIAISQKIKLFRNWFGDRLKEPSCTLFWFFFQKVYFLRPYFSRPETGFFFSSDVNIRNVQCVLFFIPFWVLKNKIWVLIFWNFSKFLFEIFPN